MKPKVIISANSSWNIINFRSSLVSLLIQSDYDVVVLAPYDEFSERIKNIGCEFIPIAIDSKGMNPIIDIGLFIKYLLALSKIKGGVYLGFTAKPNIYGSLAAQCLGLPVINNISGLGTAFIRGGWLGLLVKTMYRFALSRSKRIFFQNIDDCNLFVRSGIVQPNAVDVIPGSGVNLKKYSAEPLPENKCIRFLLIGRMLRDKGVYEYVEAAHILAKEGIAANFCLLGFLDVENSTAITKNEMDEWVNRGIVNYLGATNDVRTEIKLSDCVVLPSYREGTPRSLLEAASMARPIITTDAVGCREVVDDGVNGYLCKIKDPVSLAEMMKKFLHISHLDRVNMGLKGRAKMESKFDENIVLAAYIREVQSIAGPYKQ